jgi:hypothetical protein
VRRGDWAQTLTQYYFYVRQLPAIRVAADACAVGAPALGHRAAKYQELKSELGLDRFEGRRWPGRQHHTVLTAVAHACIQRERMRHGAAGLTFPAVRAIVQEILTALLFAANEVMHWMEQAKRNLQLRI